MSIALDETTNTLYVGSLATLYKLDAGPPLMLPSLLQNLTLDVADGETIYGLTLDVANGFGERICKGKGW